MNNSAEAEELPENGDFQMSNRPAANVGKRFYTWATLGTFAGACFLVSGIWAIFKRLWGTTFASEAWPLLFTAVVVVAFAFATQPEQKTTLNQKIQKGLVTLGNVLLVYLTIIGANIAIAQAAGTAGG
jgi:hypothetical protein